MRRIGLLIILTAIPLTVLLFSKVQDLRKRAAEGTYVLRTVRLTNDAAYQRDPDVFEDRVVWQDYAVRNADIRGAEINLENLEWQRMNIPGRDGADWAPRVGQKGVVWWSPTGSDEGEIYLWQGGEIMNVSDHGSQQWDPDIWENTIVWEDWRKGNPDIYSFNLTTEKIATPSAERSYEEKPSVWKDIVVWHDFQGFSIYYRDMSTGEGGPLDKETADPPDQRNQDISDDLVVWQDKRNGNWDIYGYNLASRQPVEIYSGPRNQTNPSVSGDYVVWEDDSRGNKDIRGINLLTREIFDIAATDKDEITPAIDGQLVVWEEDPNGVSDIVLAKLRPLSSGPPAPFLQSLESQFADLSVVLRWLVNQSLVQNIVSLRLSLATTGGEVVERVSLPINASTHTFSDLQNGQRYISTLEALDSTGKVLQSLSVTEVPRCRLEDLNGSGEVDIFDIVLIARSFGSREGEERYDAVADLIGDGEINIFDVVKVARAWGQGC